MGLKLGHLRFFFSCELVTERDVFVTNYTNTTVQGTFLVQGTEDTTL